jgi:hypothetical protein
MAKRRLSPKERQKDLEAYAAMQAAADYAPSNPEFSVANVTASYDEMQESQTSAVQAKAAAKAARDKEVDDEWAFHAKIQGVKTQFAAQYGEDSDEVQSLGLKKKSEYNSPSKKKTTPST